MKIKTSIILSQDLLEDLERVTGEKKNRSAAIELALREFVENRRRRMREARDLQILNQKAASLNQEAQDVLAYQEEI